MLVKIHFSIIEYNLTGKDIPEIVADKIMNYHAIPMSYVREKFGSPIKVSQKSGYRPVWYEKERGRSGTSQHCFEDTKEGKVIVTGKGAADYTATDLEGLLTNLIDHSPYTRICFYKDEGFIHCDYKCRTGKRQYFEKVNESNWEFIRNV